MRRKLLIFLLLAIALGGFLASLFFAWQQPLWLDERYSLFFAWTLSPFELLYHSKDVHPGLFYVALKYTLLLTKNLVVLRVLLSVIPQWVGAAALLWWLLKKKLSQTALIIGAILLFLNPFVIYTTIQLRMYGLVFLLTCLTYVLVDIWYKKQTLKNLLLLLAVLAVGNSISYSFFFVSFGVLLFWAVELFKKDWKSVWKAGAAGAAFVGEFVLLAGLSVKHHFEAAAWIPDPNFTNIPSLFLTTIGLDSNFFLIDTPATFKTFLFYVVGLGVLFWFAKLFNQNKKSSKMEYKLLCLLVAPGALLFLLSLIFPILSQRFFFYQFVPKLSLFLPRIFLPLVVILSGVVTESVSHLTKGVSPVTKQLLLVFFILLVLGWGFSFRHQLVSLTSSQANEDHTQSLVRLAKELNEKNGFPTYFLPSWIWLSQIAPETLSQIAHVGNLTRLSETFEKQVADSDSCDVTKNVNVIFDSHEMSPSILAFYQKNAEQMEHCCQEERTISTTTVWVCQ